MRYPKHPRPRVIRVLISIFLLGLNLPAQAGRLTDTADAVDSVTINGKSQQDPFDVYVGTEFIYRSESGTIGREPINGILANDPCSASSPGKCDFRDELSFHRSEMLMEFQAQLGLFRDLALTLDLPIIINRSLSFGYSPGISAQQSSIDPQDTGNPAQTLFAQNYATDFGGVGQMKLGLRYAPLNDERVKTDPSWLLFFKWAMPYTSSVYRPMADKEKASKPVGTGVHFLTFGTAFSKRVAELGMIGIDPNIQRRGYLDPYLLVSYTRPVPDRSLAEQALLYKPSNTFGTTPSHKAQIMGGLEIVLHEDLAQNQLYSVDCGFKADFHSEGRNYSLLTAPLNELTFTEQFFEFGGVFHALAQPNNLVRVELDFSLGTRSPYFLTNENVGEDTNGDNKVRREDNDLLNPYYCGNEGNDLCAQNSAQHSYDQIGFRFRSQDYFFWSLGLNISLML